MGYHIWGLSLKIMLILTTLSRMKKQIVIWGPTSWLLLDSSTDWINVLLFALCNRVSLVIPPCQRSRYATYFDVAVLRCLLQPHWSEEGTQWSLMYYLQRLRHMLEEKPEKSFDPEIPPLPRPRSSSMVAATPSLVNTHKTQVKSGNWMTNISSFKH